jgi:hypothetical protein
MLAELRSRYAITTFVVAPDWYAEAYPGACRGVQSLDYLHDGR